jgi:hypothetical protein
MPAKWIFVMSGTLGGLALLVCAISPSLRYSFVTGWEVRSLIRFRDQFRMDRFEDTCPNYHIYRAVACVSDMIRDQGRLRYASLTARIYYLSTLVSAAEVARGSANSVVERIDACLDILDYLNEEMKLVLVHTGGAVDLSFLDSRSRGAGLVEDPEIILRRQYYANLVDLWIKNWRRDEKFLVANREAGDVRTQRRIDMLRADRDELFSRLSIDLSRYDKKRMPAEATKEVAAAPHPLETRSVPSPLPHATAPSPTLLSAGRSLDDVPSPERTPSALPTPEPSSQAIPPHLRDDDERIEIEETVDNR